MLCACVCVCVRACVCDIDVYAGFASLCTCVMCPCAVDCRQLALPLLFALLYFGCSVCRHTRYPSYLSRFDESLKQVCKVILLII